MKALILSLLASSLAYGGEVNLDKIETISCTVTRSKIRSSFIPPKAGDKIDLPLWALDMSDGQLRFETVDGKMSYIPLPVHALERVDRAPFRSPSRRTFVGVDESFANLSRVEAWLNITSDEERGTITMHYQTSHKDLTTGKKTEEVDLLEADCVATKLWK